MESLVDSICLLVVYISFLLNRGMTNIALGYSDTWWHWFFFFFFRLFSDLICFVRNFFKVIVLSVRMCLKKPLPSRSYIVFCGRDT